MKECAIFFLWRQQYGRDVACAAPQFQVNEGLYVASPFQNRSNAHPKTLKSWSDSRTPKSCVSRRRPEKLFRPVCKYSPLMNKFPYICIGEPNIDVALIAIQSDVLSIMLYYRMYSTAYNKGFKSKRFGRKCFCIGSLKKIDPTKTTLSITR